MHELMNIQECPHVPLLVHLCQLLCAGGQLLTYRVHPCSDVLGSSMLLFKIIASSYTHFSKGHKVLWLPLSNSW